MNTFKSWYTERGFLQFLLGNEIGDENFQSVGGPMAMIICWMGTFIVVASTVSKIIEWMS